MKQGSQTRKEKVQNSNKKQKIQLQHIRRIDVQDDHTIKFADLQLKKQSSKDNQNTINPQSISKTTSYFQSNLGKNKTSYDRLAPKIKAQQSKFVQKKDHSKQLQNILAGPSLRQRYGKLVNCQKQICLDDQKQLIYTLFSHIQSAIYMRVTFRDNAPCFYSDIRKAIQSRSKLEFRIVELQKVMSIGSNLFILSWKYNSNIKNQDILIKKIGLKSLSQRRINFRNQLNKHKGQYQYKLPQKQSSKQQKEEQITQTIKTKKIQRKMPQYDMISFQPSQQFPDFQYYLKTYIQYRQQKRNQQKQHNQIIQKSVSTKFLQTVHQFFVMKRVNNAFKVTLIQQLQKRGFNQNQLKMALAKCSDYITQTQINTANIIKVNKTKFKQVLQKNAELNRSLGIVE